MDTYVLDPTAYKKIPGEAKYYGMSDVLGMTLDPIGWATARYAEYGPVSWTNFLGQRMVLMMGPDANEFVLLNRGNVFSSKLAWNWFIEPFFRRGVMLRDFEEHRAHRQVMQTAFRKEALQNYIDMMNPEIDKLTKRWLSGPVGGTFGKTVVRVFPTLKKLTLDLASTIFLGEKLGPIADELNQAFVDAVRGGGAIVRYPLPGNLMWKGIKGREVLERYFYSKIAEKRAKETPDFFSQFCHARAEDGTTFTDRDVVDHMIFLLMAAHDTTTITLTTMFYQLAKHPEWQERCRSEVQVLNKQYLEYEDLDKLVNIELVMKEAIRMIPPVPGVPRMAVQDVEFQGFHIPKGALINVPFTFTHHMEEFWPNHRRFDPERFTPERAEDKKHRFQWVPFGGGVHKCLGMHFADLQVKAILNQVLKQYRWRVAPWYKMNIDNTSLPKPADDLPVLLEAIN